MKLLLRLELRIVLAALRRIVTHPSRRMLWFGVVALAVAAVAFDIATSGVASRDLGAWRPQAPVIAVAGTAILAFAALIGTRTQLTYGTRAADALWWRFAGVAAGIGERGTTAILTARATVFIALGAIPVSALLALAAPQAAPTIVGLAVVAVLLAPAVVLVSSAFARRLSAMAPDARHGRVGAVVDGERLARSSPASQTSIPRGLAAARWLIAARRGEMVVPYDRLAFGIVAGLIAPRLAAVAGGQTVAMAIVVGGLAVLLDAAIRGTTAPAALRSPWWCAAVGTSPGGLAAWAFCDGAGATAPLIGIAAGLGIALRSPLHAVAAIPAILLLPAALRLVVLAVDTMFPAAADRRGAGASLRIFVVSELAADIFALALWAGAYGGAFASLAVTAVALLAVVAAAALCASVRLPHAVG
jgi:hypothetical protein